MSGSDEQRLSVKYSSASSSASEIDTSATVAVAPYAMAVLSFVVVIVRGEKNNASVRFGVDWRRPSAVLSSVPIRVCAYPLNSQCFG